MLDRISLWEEHVAPRLYFYFPASSFLWSSPPDWTQTSAPAIYNNSYDHLGELVHAAGCYFLVVVSNPRHGVIDLICCEPAIED